MDRTRKYHPGEETQTQKDMHGMYLFVRGYQSKITKYPGYNRQN